ncbi:MAG: DUF3883 domain-containing protein [Acidobacteria bacterium]|nr:DUF3883 domain-containing protein [Acidobacteriota bacterium]
MPENWSKREVEAAVEDYFIMLQMELAGQNYNKSAHRRALKRLLNDRSDSSVENKHQNISAVLIELGIPYITGYKPLFNYQRSLLPQAISEYLAAHPKLQDLFLRDSLLVPETPNVEDILAILDQPPSLEKISEESFIEEAGYHSPMGQNYIEQEACNRALGEAGEKFIINFERARLIKAGKNKLAGKVEQVSISHGPSAGFDILSFEENGKDRYIEGKTTKYGKNTPFFLTANEFRFSEKHAANYYIYRIFGFRKNPRMYTLQGQLGKRCILTPTQYLVAPR